MASVKAILDENTEHRLDELIPTESRVREIETQLGLRLHPDYREFVLLGGLNDLRFTNRPLTLEEMRESLPQVAAEYVPFASDGCGDLFCWRKLHPEGAITRWLHETGEYTQAAESFIDWLRQNRF